MNAKWSIMLIVAVIVIVSMGIAGCDSDEGTIAEGAIVVNTDAAQTGIWVDGEGKVFATPDLATLSLGIETEAETVAEAQEQAAQTMNDVMATLKNTGIEEKDIKTSQYNIYPVRRWDDETNQQITLGYRVDNMVTVKIREIQKTGEIIDTVTQAGGDLTRIQGITFSVDDPTPYQEEARKKAFDQAKAKAEQIAMLSGKTLGEVTYVTETSGYIPPVRYAVAKATTSLSSGDISTPISTGEQEISVSLQVAFAIQ